MAVSLSIRCPACSGPLQPVALACPACQIRVEGHFEQNEFASLGAEDLHLLRIFVHTEGRIRDMEAALGVSYPTIKNRLADLRSKLGMAPTTEATTPQGEPERPRSEPNDQPASRPDRGRSGSPGARDDVSSVLDALESGQIDPNDAVARLRRQRRK